MSEGHGRSTVTVSSYYYVYRRLKEHAARSGVKIVFIMDKAVECLRQHPELLDSRLEMPNDEVSLLDRALAVHPSAYAFIKDVATSRKMSVREVVARAVECYFTHMVGPSSAARA